LTFGSLFAGIGGLDLGLERAGMECKWQVEIDDYCQKVLAKHWPDITLYGDVHNVGNHNLEAIDLICGGFPCQDVSQQGLRKGITKGTRSGLWFEFHRIIEEMQPQWAIIENVRGLLSIDNGAGFGTVLRDLATIRYNAEWACFPASAFGAHHKRYRVFIVAYPQSRNVQPPKQTRACQSSTWEQEQGHTNRDRGIFAQLPTIDPRLSSEPRVGRVAHGIPHRVDRLRALGNAVVPQVAEWIGQRILEMEAMK